MGAFVTLSIVLGVVSALLGEAASLEWDLPLGPAIVVACALFLVPSRFARA
jgi:ABC-type Mn2+/Zn2+ transport system permease subunit